MGSPSEAWFYSRFIPVNQGVFPPCHCCPRLTLRGSQARALFILYCKKRYTNKLSGLVTETDCIVGNPSLIREQA